MPTSDDWKAMITDGFTRRPLPVTAQTFEKCFQSDSRPALMICSDKRRYVVKGHHMQKVPVNDQIMGKLGVAIGAPVADVALVNVPAELIEGQPELKASGMLPGISHGAVYHPDVSQNREDLAHFTVSENRSRFASLAIMYGWAGCFTDHQFFYKNDPPRLVLSFDHGHFFPGGPNWTIQGLASAPSAIPDAKITTTCKLTAEEIAGAKPILLAVTDVLIADAVAIPCDHWRISIDERAELASLLSRRRSELLAA